MRRPVPAVGLLCAAMRLLGLLANLPTTAVAAVNISTVPCVPAACGNLAIAYPFWIAGTHQPYCGYKAFQVTCVDQKVYLTNSYWMYQVLDISYENSSFVVTNVNVQEYCDLTLAGNASSDLGAGPFKISDRNRGLFFLSYCQGKARQLPPPWAPMDCSQYDSPNSFAWLAGSYRANDILKPLLPGNCSVSLMPVLGYLGAVAADYDYERLIKGGFLLEYNYTVQDCAPCAQTGGKCSVDAGADVLQCRCPDGVHSCGGLQ